MAAYCICGKGKSVQEKKPIPEDCTLVTIPSSFRKVVETAFLNPKYKQWFLNPVQHKANLKKLFEIQDKDFTVAKYKDQYTNIEHDLFSYSNKTLFNSGVYEIGVKKDWMEYKSKQNTFPVEDIQEAFDRAILPQNVVMRLEKVAKKSKYTYDEIQSVLKAWPFYEDVYTLCKKAKDAVENGDKKQASTLLKSLSENIDIVTLAHNKGNEWVTPLLRFRDDLDDSVKDMSRENNTKLQKTYTEIIEIKKNQRRGGFQQSYLFKKYPGVHFVFLDKKSEANEDPIDPEHNEEETNTIATDEESTSENNTTASETSDIPPSVTTVTFQLGNKVFSLDKGVPAYARRSAYFFNKEGALTKDEKAILLAVGIDQEMEERLKAYLPKFFDVLPDCQTDASLYLSKQCEVPYFVVWSTKFAERQQTLQRLKDNADKTKPMSDYDMAINQAVVSEMRAQYTDIDQLFAIIRTRRSNRKGDETPFQIDDLFTLIKVE